MQGIGHLTRYPGAFWVTRDVLSSAEFLLRLDRRLSQEPGWIDFIAGLRERHRRLLALKEKLSNSGL